MLYGISLLDEDFEVRDQVNSSAVRFDVKSKVNHGLEYIGRIDVDSEGNERLKCLSKVSRRNAMSVVAGYSPPEHRPVWFAHMLCRS